MKKLLFSFAALSVLCCFSFNVSAKELIREFKGSESRTTPEFEVQAPWIVDWRVSGDYPGQMAVQVDLLSAGSGQYVGKIVTTKYVTNGVRLFNESGRYLLQVNSSLANWTLRVEQLSRKEAESYTPREKPAGSGIQLE